MVEYRSTPTLPSERAGDVSVYLKRRPALPHLLDASHTLIISNAPAKHLFISCSLFMVRWVALLVALLSSRYALSWIVKPSKTCARNFPSRMAVAHCGSARPRERCSVHRAEIKWNFARAILVAKAVGGGGGDASEESPPLTIALGRGDETSFKRLPSPGIGNGSLSGEPVEVTVGTGPLLTTPLPVNFGLARGTGAMEVPVGRLLLSLVPFACEM